MVGDTMETDIRGAIEIGMQACLVLSGSTRLEDLADYVYQPTCVMSGVDQLLAEIQGHGSTSRLQASSSHDALIFSQNTVGVRWLEVQIGLFRQPRFERLQQCVTQARFEGRRPGEGRHAEALNATEFIETQIENQRNNHLQVEFTVGNANDIVASFVLNPPPECILVGAGREVDATLMYQKWSETGRPGLGLDWAFPFGPLGFFSPTIGERTQRKIGAAIHGLDVPCPWEGDVVEKGSGLPDEECFFATTLHTQIRFQPRAKRIQGLRLRDQLSL